MPATVYLHPKVSLKQTLRIMRRENCTTEYDGSHVRLVPILDIPSAPRRSSVRRTHGLSDSGLERLMDAIRRMT